LILTFLQTVASVVQATKAFIPSIPAAPHSSPDSSSSAVPASTSSQASFISSPSVTPRPGLSKGQIVGISIGSVAGVSAVAIAIFANLLGMRRGAKSRHVQMDAGE
jgi:hypothetical protein